MNKRKLTLLMTLALGLSAAPASAQGTVSAQGTAAQTLPAAQNAPADPRLPSSAVSLEIGTYSGPLSSLLAAVARTAGYDIIFETNIDALTAQTASGQNGSAQAGVGQTTTGQTAVQPVSALTPTKQVVYNFHNTPFNQVWPLLMDLYGLSYTLTTVGTTPVLRVGTNPVQDVIPLANASAADAVNQIKLFFGTPSYTETPVKDAQGNVTGTTRTLTDVRLDSATLRIVPDVRSNTLIVRGTSREVQAVRALAAQLDTQVKTTTAPTTSSATVQQVYTVKGAQSDIVAVFAAQYPDLKVTPVGTSGQLILQGPRNVIDAAVTLISTVDKPVQAAAAPDVVQKVFSLVNAQATSVKTLLDDALARNLTSSQTTAQTPQATVSVQNANGTVTTVPNLSVPQTAAVSASTGSATSTSAATIIADARTNTLVIRGTQQQVSQIAELIPAFDVRVAQINLQVRIQEVNQTASRALGVDWKAGFGSFVVNLASTAVKAIFDPTQALAGFNLGATLNALETQGMTKRVYDGSVTMQSGQRALSSSSTVDNASSDAAAHVQSGGRIELNIPSQAAGVPSIQRQIDYGVTLDFYNPQVAPDGTITVRVRGKVAGQPNDITNPQLLQYTNSEAQTTVSFRPGETVMLTGLMGTNNGSTTSGVPFLASLPVVGSLFGKTTSTTERSQLLVVLTGDVLK